MNKQAFIKAWMDRLREGCASFRSSEPEAGKSVILAGLPHMLFFILAGGSALLQSSSSPILEQFAWSHIRIDELLGVSMGIVVISVLILAWRKDWPLWSASWYGYGLWFSMVALSLLDKYVDLISFRFFNNILILSTLLILGIGYFILIRYDLRRALLAIFFLAPNYMLSFMEFVPDQIEAFVYFIVGIVVVLAVTAVVQLRELCWTILLVVCGNVITSVIVAYVQEFHADYPKGYNYSPSFGDWFIQAVFMSLVMVAIVLGPLLLWQIWDQRRRIFKQ